MASDATPARQPRAARSERDASQSPTEREQSSVPEGGEESSARPRVRAAPLTHEAFCTGFDRCFDRVYAYVGRHVSDRESCERIVGEVLENNLELLVERRDEKYELSRLKANADRLIGLEPAPPSHGPPPEEPGTGPSA